MGLCRPQLAGQDSTALKNLFEAIAASDLPQVRQILKASPKLLNAQLPEKDEDWYDVRPIDVAAGLSSTDVFRYLLDHNATINTPDFRTAFWIVDSVEFGVYMPRKDYKRRIEPDAQIRNRQYEKLKLLIERRPQTINELQSTGTSLFNECCRADWLEAAELLRKNGANVRVKDQFGATAWFNANSAEVVDYLAKLSFDPNDKWKGLTLLHLAVERADRRNLNTDLVRAIVKVGGRFDSVDNDGETPLDLAVRFCSPEAIKSLIACGADPNGVSPANGRTPLDYTAEGMYDEPSSPDSAIALLDSGADVKKPDGNGDPPALGVVRMYVKRYQGPSTGPRRPGWDQYMLVLKLFKERGADLLSPNNKSGENALDILKRAHEDRAAQALASLAAGASN